ncbi:MAG: hypothetical protein ACREIA_08060 [Opitutaceae bacterium]
MFKRLFFSSCLFLALGGAVFAQRVMENLGRGVVAVHQPDGRVFISWRLLATDPEGVAFNVYRKSEAVAGRTPQGPGWQERRRGDGDPDAPVKLNETPLAGPTWFIDERANLGMKVSYTVAAVVDGVEQEAGAPFIFEAGAPPLPYQSIPLKTASRSALPAKA